MSHIIHLIHWQGLLALHSKHIQNSALFTISTTIPVVQTTWIIIPSQTVFPRPSQKPERSCHSLLTTLRRLCERERAKVLTWPTRPYSVALSLLLHLPLPACSVFLANLASMLFLDLTHHKGLRAIPLAIPSDWNAFPQISTWISPCLLKVSAQVQSNQAGFL